MPSRAAAEMVKFRFYGLAELLKTMIANDILSKAGSRAAVWMDKRADL